MPELRTGASLALFGRRLTDDLHGVLHEVQAAGFAGVEVPAAAAGSAELGELLADHDLALIGLHAGWSDIADDSRRASLLDRLVALRGRFLVVSGTAGRETLADFERSADRLNQAGRTAADRGGRLLWHHHGWEFKPLEGGVRGIDRLIERLEPTVGLAADAYWMQSVGVDSAAFLRSRKGRVNLLHLKDGSGGGFCELGRGTVPLRSAVSAAREIGVEWLVDAPETSRVPPGQLFAADREFLRRLGV